MIRQGGWVAMILALSQAGLVLAADEIPNGEAAFGPPPSAAWARAAANADPRILDAMPNGTGVFAPRVLKAVSAEVLAGQIDKLLADHWAEMGASPAPPAEDSEFLRRVHLDLAGRIPTAAETRAFLDDRDPQKRRKLIDRLLASPAFINHQANTWKDILVPESRGSFLIRFFEPVMDAWLKNRLAGDARLDVMVREILTVPVGATQNVFNMQPDTKPTPIAFVAAKDGKPENLAAAASRVFMGVRLECAQCHNHPFAKWKREEFWGLASFFAGINRQGSGDAIFQGTETNNKSSLSIPGTTRTVQATFLDGGRPLLKPNESPRAALAEWMTSADNPYFARASVNRVWAQFFGIGIVDPVDDLGAGIEPSHPALFDLLADQFAANQFDLRYLSRAIVLTKAYQLSSAGGSPSSDVYHLFDRMPVRGLTPLQLYESLVRAAGLPREVDQSPFVIDSNSNRGEFLERFQSQDEKPTDHQTSILQALTLLNGRMVDTASSVERGKTLRGIADAYFLDTPAKIEALYLAALSRRPRAEELERLVAYVERGGPTLDPKKALSDLFWSLLGSAEFVYNH
ncbi:MAG: DUF1549 and DUF1553 domain-containing protein [Isosphaeraceae bacterium]